MNDPWRKALELTLKGLVAFVAVLASLWLLGIVFSFLGGLLLGIAAFIVAVLRIVIPLALLAGFVYLIVWLLNRPGPAPAAGASAPAGETLPFVTPLTDPAPAPAETVIARPAEPVAGAEPAPTAEPFPTVEPMPAPAVEPTPAGEGRPVPETIPIEPIVDTKPAVTPAPGDPLEPERPA